MGRPKLDDSLKRQQLNIRVSPETIAILKALAEMEGVTVPYITEKLVVDGIFSLMAGKFQKK